MRRIVALSAVLAVLLTGHGHGTAAEGPTAERFVFIRTDELWTIRADGSEERKILALPQDAGRYATPDLSPDGQRVAVTRCRFEKGQSQKCDLVVVGIDGSNESTVPLPATATNPLLPRWSPDGRLLVFTSTPPDRTWEPVVRVVAVDGSGFRELGPGVGDGWSPDGELLVHTPGEGSNYRVSKPSEVRLRTLDGKTDRLLRTYNDFLPYLMAFSPDGTMIAYNSNSPYPSSLTPPPWEEVMNADGSGRRRVGPGREFSYTGVTWTSDSRTLVIGGLGAMDLAGRAVGTLSDRAGRDPRTAAPTGPMRCGQGYWLVAEDGGVFAYGEVGFHGSIGNLRLTRPIVGIAATPTGNGYWLVASDGGIFAFGDARFHGSTGGQRLNKPVVGMAATPTGNGYWLVASDGGIFAFGDARFYGSTGSTKLDQPVVAVTPTAAGTGYWLSAADGGVFNFGGARYEGNAAELPLGAPVRGAAGVTAHDGLLLVASDGQVVPLGTARFCGSPWQTRLARPIVGAAIRPPTS